MDELSQSKGKAGSRLSAADAVGSRVSAPNLAAAAALARYNSVAKRRVLALWWLLPVKLVDPVHDWLQS
jgi:hypothetical protein